VSADSLLTYLGPPGSFTHAAVDLLSSPWQGGVEPRAGIADVIFSVESGEADAGVVPLESSVEGDITSTVDELIFRSSLCFINEELIVPINYVVAGLAGERTADLRRIITTSAASAQCRRFLESTSAEVTLVASTAAACEAVLADGSPHVAAVTNARSARLHGLAVLRGVAEDHSGLSTRMALLRRQVAAPTGHDKSAVVVTPTGDRTGVLVDILARFAERDIALTAISSRALRTKQGEYSFLISARGHIRDERLQLALQDVAELPADIKLLGSYAALVDSGRNQVLDASPPGSVDADHLGAWLDNLLDGR